MGRSRKTFWTLDCETDPFKHQRFPQPFIWGAYEGDSGEYLELGTAAEVALFFQKQKTTVYAHNGGKFDYHYLREYINSDEPLLVINGRLAKFRIGECEFRDSLNLFPNTRLKDFGNKLEIDYKLLEPEARKDPNVMAEIKRYLRQDCVGLWEVIRRYWDEYGRSLTQAGASMRVWQKMSGLTAPRQTKAQHDRYRPYYYGGRVQCFEQGIVRTNFKVADINSAYPRAMLESHPFSPEGILESSLPPDSKLHTCLVTLDCTSRNALPWKEENTQELYFPDDEAGNRNRVRRYHVTGYELMTAFELNALSNVKIKEVHRFPMTVEFSSYINRFWDHRKIAKETGDVAGAMFDKYFMNSLYGKFGSNPENYAEYVIARDETVESWAAQGYYPYKLWGDRHLMCRTPTEAELNSSDGKWRYYNVATAASVTGYVRALLFTSLTRCSRPLYCDTDSISAVDTSSLDFGTKLGQWKDEGAYDYAAIAGKKMYAKHKQGMAWEYDGNEEDEKKQTWKIACKGVNFRKGLWLDEQGKSVTAESGRGKLFTGPELITQIAQGERIDYEPEAPTFSLFREPPDPRRHSTETFTALSTKSFIARNVRATAKDMSKAPEVV